MRSHLFPLLASIVTFPILAVVSSSCSTVVRKEPVAEHNLPGKLEATEAKPGVFDLVYKVSSETTPSEFRRYAAHQVADLCLEKGFSYFQVLSASAGLKEVEGNDGIEKVMNRKATGRVLFLKELPADQSAVIFDASDMHDNLTVWDSAGDA
jgi:hypothetical protein